MPLVITVENGTGLADANSYISLADANAYFASRPRSEAWVKLSDDEKKAMLVHTTRILDGSMSWWGEPLQKSQALVFPRKPDIYDSAAVPRTVPMALCELAVTLNARDITAEPTKSGFSEIEVGPIKLKEAGEYERPATISKFVSDLLAAYGTPRGKNRSVPLTRS